MQRLLSTGETPCASHPMHKMWATFCRQVTTRLRCSSQLPWLQKSEMVWICWSYWNHSKYGMQPHAFPVLHSSYSTFTRVEIVTVWQNWLSHLRWTAKSSTAKAWMWVPAGSQAESLEQRLKLQAVCLLYVLDVRVNHRYLYLHHVHIYIYIYTCFNNICVYIFIYIYT